MEVIDGSKLTIRLYGIVSCYKHDFYILPTFEFFASAKNVFPCTFCNFLNGVFLGFGPNSNSIQFN